MIKLAAALPAMALCALIPSLAAQSANDYVSAGRTYLAGTNLSAANLSFSNAVALSPQHPAANVFYAATRLLVLPSEPAGGNFLSRLGMPSAGRDLYGWTAGLPADTNGVVLAPEGMSAQETTAMLRTNVLPALVAAGANLAQVTDGQFTLSLSSNETRMASITLDYGDVLMFRAMLHAAEYVLYTIHSWNLDAQFDSIRDLYTSEQLSIERLLADYPNLLTFATTQDLAAARLAFQNSVDRYLEASQFIRSRPGDVIRFFNIDEDSAESEEQFRTALIDLKRSLNGAVPLTMDTNYTVFFASHFSGARSLRSFLPEFRGNSFAMGTLPDPTFGGLIYGIGRQDAEEILAQMVPSIPAIEPGSGMLGPPIQFPILVARGRGYVVQVSSNLRDWADHLAFVSLGGPYGFVDRDASALSRRFYRVVDRTGAMPPPANDAFENRAVIPGMDVPVASYTDNATRQPGELQQGGAGHTVWWSWTAPTSGRTSISASGDEGCWLIGVFTGTAIGGLTPVANGFERLEFDAVAGITYQIAVDTCWDDGGVRVVISR